MTALDHRVNYLKLILLVCLASISRQMSDEALADRKRNLLACIKLSKIVLTDDRTYIVDTTRKLIPQVFKTKYDEVFEKVSTGILLSCFSQISMIKAAEITNANPKAVNPYTKENKQLLSVDYYLEKFEANKENFSRQNALYQEVKKEVQTEMVAYEELIANGIDPLIGANYKKGSQHSTKRTDRQGSRQEQEETQGENLDEDSYSNLDLSVFGFDFNKMSPGVKNLLGLGMLGLLFGGILLAFNKVLKKEEPVKKKKNRNKEE